MDGWQRFLLWKRQGEEGVENTYFRVGREIGITPQ